MCEADYCDGKSSIHKVIYKDTHDKTLCFKCAVQKAMGGELIETEMEYVNTWQCCAVCGN